MMNAWWSELSQRERILIFIAAGLLSVLFVSVLIVQPLTEWRQSAAANAERARDNYQLVATAAATAKEGGDQAQRGAVPLRQAVIGSAAAANIELVRIGAELNSQIEVQPALTDGETLFGWFGVLENEYGVTVSFADISHDENGMLNAQILVFRRR